MTHALKTFLARNPDFDFKAPDFNAQLASDGTSLTSTGKSVASKLQLARGFKRSAHEPRRERKIA